MGFANGLKTLFALAPVTTVPSVTTEPNPPSGRHGRHVCHRRKVRNSFLEREKETQFPFFLL